MSKRIGSSFLLVLFAVVLVASSTSADYVDDGRYDYQLSQPDAKYTVKVENNIDIPMPDGTKLKGDLYRPDAEGRFPVLISEAPYPRAATGPAIMTGPDDFGGADTSYVSFEQINPGYLIPRGYVFLTFSPRGYGGSEGKSSVLSVQEYYDIRDAIDWAGTQPWSNGNVGMYGISYYAFSQWYVPGLKPKHLKALVPWEGLCDPYPDIAYQGGIQSRFISLFILILNVNVNDPTTTPDYTQLLNEHPLYDDPWERGISVIWDPASNPNLKIRDFLKNSDTPMLSVGNLNDPDLHLHGNVTGFMASRSDKKKLLLYSGTHWGSPYQPWANRTVLRFFDHWLKGVDTGINKEPAVDIELRTGEETISHVYGDTFPLPQTKWKKYYLNASDKSLSVTEPKASSSAVAEYLDEPNVGNGAQVTFSTGPLKQDIAVAGPLSAHFWVASETNDVDLILELRDFDAKGQETRFAYYNAGDRLEPVTRGWLKASMRALDPERSTEHWPIQSLRKNDWLTPGEPVAVDVEIWPTSMVFKAGHSMALTIHCGPYARYGDPLYGSNSTESGKAEIFTGGGHSSWLDLPVIPADSTPVHKINVDDGHFKPERVAGKMGERFEWTNSGDDYHSATESSGLHLWDSQLINGTRSHKPETWWTKIDWASTFKYRDMVAVWDFKGTIAIPVEVPASVNGNDGATITLGKTAPPKGIGFEVQLKKDSGAWKSIASGVSSTQFTTEKLDKGTYTVRVRLLSVRDNKLATDWSPEATFTVATGAATADAGNVTPLTSDAATTADTITGSSASDAGGLLEGDGQVPGNSAVGNANSSGGCGCRAAGVSNSTALHLLAGLLLLALVFRRRIIGTRSRR